MFKLLSENIIIFTFSPEASENDCFTISVTPLNGKKGKKWHNCFTFMYVTNFLKTICFKNKISSNYKYNICS